MGLIFLNEGTLHLRRMSVLDLGLMRTSTDMNLRRKIFAIAAMAATLFAAPALAHTAIQTANIENGATLTEAPPAFEFSFGSAVGLAALELETAAGKAVEMSFDLPRDMQKDFFVALPPLLKNVYVLKWRAVAKDGHVMKGEVSFTITG